MRLYERLLKERVEEEQPCGKSLPPMHGLISKVMVRRLEESRGHPGYAANLAMITRGPRNAGEGLRPGSLKARYRKEYGELSAERRGQQELL